jgi:PDZ domain-containing protein
VAINAKAPAKPVIRNVDTQDQTLSPPPAPLLTNQDSAKKRRKWPYIVAAIALLFAGIAVPVGINLYDDIQGAVNTVPYFVFSPGDATPTENHIDGKQVKLYPAAGEVLYTTVSVHRMTRSEYSRYKNNKLNPTWDVITEADYLGVNTRTQEREEGIRQMTDSKKSAMFVALQQLGYPVTIANGGALIVTVEPAVPAASVLHAGDLIVGIEGSPVQSSSDVRTVLKGRAAGSTVNLTVRPKGSADDKPVAVTLARRDDGTGYIGVGLTLPETAQFTFPVDLDIDTGDVGGPSAGLAFTLAVLDVLTPGELTGGKKVAVTGTIDPNGFVGQIGGVKQKTIAAQAAGAALFLVPAPEVDEAKKFADPSKMQVVGVNTVVEALSALDHIGGNSLHLGTPGAPH